MSSSTTVNTPSVRFVVNQTIPAENLRVSSPNAEDSLNKLRTRCEIWTRVMGYHRPISHFNIGKKSEHISRKHFDECVVANSRFNNTY